MKKREKIEDRLMQTYTLIQENIKNNGFPPTVRELMDEMKIKSTSTISYYLDRLEEQGYIKKSTNKKRSIELVNKNNYETNKTTKKVALLGEVAAGQPIFAYTNYDDVYEISTNLFNSTGDIFMLTVKGDSMINIGMLNGDKIVVRQQPYADNNEIVVAMIEGNVTVKRFFKEKNRIRLQPENNNMQPIYADNVQILGKVIGLVRQY